MTANNSFFLFFFIKYSFLYQIYLTNFCILFSDYNQQNMSHQGSDNELEERAPEGAIGRGHGGRGRSAPEPPVGGAIGVTAMNGRGHAKGRPPMFGRAMTPTEKMHGSREKKREAIGEEAYAALMKIKYKEYHVSIK